MSLDSMLAVHELVLLGSPRPEWTEERLLHVGADALRAAFADCGIEEGAYELVCEEYPCFVVHQSEETEDRFAECGVGNVGLRGWYPQFGLGTRVVVLDAGDDPWSHRALRLHVRIERHLTARTSEETEGSGSGPLDSALDDPQSP